MQINNFTISLWPYGQQITDLLAEWPDMIKVFLPSTGNQNYVCKTIVPNSKDPPSSPRHSWNLTGNVRLWRRLKASQPNCRITCIVSCKNPKLKITIKTITYAMKQALKHEVTTKSVKIIRIVRNNSNKIVNNRIIDNVIIIVITNMIIHRWQRIGFSLQPSEHTRTNGKLSGDKWECLAKTASLE
jgi:hypothetical protein